MIIIGITGTLGAGKGTIVEYLVEKKGFVHYSVRQFLAEVIVERKKPLNRDSMTSVANSLREIHGPSYVTDQLFYKASKTGKNCIIESIRTPGEIVSLREKGDFILVAVDAEVQIRFSRIQQRASSTDNVDFETFCKNEEREMNSTNPNAQNLQKCIEMADYKLLNNGSIEDLISNFEEEIVI